MKDKTARALAITALVFMFIFVVSLCVTLAAADLFGGAFVYITVSAGAVALVLFVIVKLDGRGYSITEINNEIELEKIERENRELIERAERENAEIEKKPDKEFIAEDGAAAEADKM